MTLEVIPSPSGSNPTNSDGATGTRPSAALGLLTESRLKSFRRCPREHHLRYELGYAPTADREALRFGTLIHAGLEAWWLERRGPIESIVEEETMEPFARAVLAMRAKATEETDAFELVKAEELMLGYHVRWESESLEAIAVEAEFRAPLINPATDAPSKTWLRAGKIDVVARDRKMGRTVLIEHKTSSEDIGAGSTYWARLRMDGQVSHYFRGAEALGHDVEACVYDVIGKVKLRPYKATPEAERKYIAAKWNKKLMREEPARLYANQREFDETPEDFRLRVREDIAANPDKYYQRGEIVRLEQEMADHDAEVWQQGRIIRENQLAGRAPKNPEACERYHSLCSFFTFCSGEASLDDERLYQILPSVHPELSPCGDPPKEEA